jgi:LysR family transcriptional regulator, hydrogen peroxide-inducible genes activator
MSQAEVGTVIVGAIPTIAPYFLGPALARFARRYPAVSISVVEEITPILLDRLHNGHVDIVVLALPVRGEELISEELFREPLFAALPQDHRLAERKSLTLG